MTQEPRKDATLSYALPQRQKKSRTIAILVVIFAFFAAASMCARLAPEVWRRAQILYLQNRLLSDCSPAGTPVYTASWTARGIERVLSETGADNADWLRLRSLCGSPAQPATAGIYTHEIRTPKGKAILVVVRLRERIGWPSDDNRYELTLDSELIEPGTFFRYPIQSVYNEPTFVFDRKLDDMAEQRLVVFGGQPDPADPTHFTIDYTVGSQRHTLDGYINEQDVLTIQERPAASTRPS